MKTVFSTKQIIFKVLASLSLLFFLILFFQAWQNLSSLFMFVFAYLCGITLLYADEQFLYRFYEEKIDLNLQNSSHFSSLASRNFLFLLLLPFLSLFVLTSSGSLWGIAFILAINCYLLIEMWQLKNQPELLQQRFFQHLPQLAQKQNSQLVVYGASIYLFILLLIVIF